MNKLIVVLLGILLASVTAKQILSNYYANDYANAAAAQYSTGSTLAYSDALAAVPYYGYGYPYYLGYPYGLGLYYGYPYGLLSTPVTSTTYLADSYTNAAAAQYSTGNTLAYSAYADPLGLGLVWPYYYKRR